MAFQRKYGVALVAATGFEISVPMMTAGSNDFDAGTWVPAAGDVKVRKNGGARANIATLPAFNNGMWDFVLSAAELQSIKTEIIIIDSATKAVEDNAIIVETFGHASAMYPTDYTAALATSATQALQSTLAAQTSMQTDITALGTAQALQATSAVQTTQNTLLARIAGLLGENAVLDGSTVGTGATYDSSGNISAGTIWIYSSKANATTHNGVTGLLYKYSITNTIASNNVTVSKQYKET